MNLGVQLRRLGDCKMNQEERNFWDIKTGEIYKKIDGLVGTVGKIHTKVILNNARLDILENGKKQKMAIFVRVISGIIVGIALGFILKGKI